MDSPIYNKKISIGNYLKQYFSQNKGCRLGETTVISTKVHGNDPKNPGTIRIFTDKDAGMHYTQTTSPNLWIHFDVFHAPASIDPTYVARRIYTAIDQYYDQLLKNSKRVLGQNYKTTTEYLYKHIQVETSAGQGTVYDLASRTVELIPEKLRVNKNHIHILMENKEEYYNCIIPIVDAVEYSILGQSFEIRKVEKIVHCLENNPKKVSLIPAHELNTPEIYNSRRKQNRLQLALDLVNVFGTIEKVADFFESMSSKRNLFKNFLKGKNDNRELDQTLLELTNHNLIKKGTLSYSLTGEGEDFKNFLKSHQQELEAHVRKAIREYQIVRHDYQTYRTSQLKSRKNHVTDHKKIADLNASIQHTDIAIPETVIKAAARSILNQNLPVRIKKEDIQVYGQKSFAPIDTCIAIDCSGSMAGEKIQAVMYLARHFMLTAKEKVSIITFQENDAKVVVPFTKSYSKLDKGLTTIKPEGQTPLAKGIVETINHIKDKKGRNPLLILITDGIPNYPLWTTDAQKDALRAAEQIAENKIRLVCIGVVPNEKFVHELNKKGGGNLYLIDDIEKNSLLDIVTKEWSSYKYK